MARSLRHRTEYEDAVRSGDDRRAQFYQNLQEQDVLFDWFVAGNTFRQPTGASLFTHPDIQSGRWSKLIAEREVAKEDILAKYGWTDVQKFYDDSVNLYKERNAAVKQEAQPWMSSEQQLEISRQYEPIVVDPDQVAEMRQRIAQIDNELKQVDPSMTIWNDRKMGRIAQFISAEAEPGRPGWMVSGEQSREEQYTAWAGGALPLLTAPIGAVANIAYSPIRGAFDYVGQAAGALTKLGAMAIDSMTGGQLAGFVKAPTNFVFGPNGEVISNTGKVGSAEIFGLMWAGLTGQKVDETIAGLADAQAFADARRRGLDGIIHGTGYGIGSLGGFVGLWGKGISKFAQLSVKGMSTLAKSAAVSDRAAKILGVTAELGGSSFAIGATDAFTRGDIDGYGKAFIEGTKMGVIMTAIGALGGSMERLLLTRKRMPRMPAKAISGALMGAGFGGLELAEGKQLFSGEDEIWQFLKNPNESTWDHFSQVMTKNILMMTIFHSMGGQLPAEEGMMSTAAESVIRAREFRRRSARTAEDFVERAEERGVPRETSQRFQEVLKEQAEVQAKDPERYMELERELGDLERQMDVAEYGVAETPVQRMEARQDLQKQIAELSRQPATPENRQRAIELIQQARGKLTTGMAQQVATQLTERGRIKEARAEAKREVDIAEEARRTGEDISQVRKRYATELRRKFEEPPAKREPVSKEMVETELDRLKREGPTPENQKRLIELLQEARGKLTSDILDKIAKEADIKREMLGEDIKNAEDVYKVQRALWSTQAMSQKEVAARLEEIRGLEEAKQEQRWAQLQMEAAEAYDPGRRETRKLVKEKEFRSMYPEAFERIGPRLPEVMPGEKLPPSAREEAQARMQLEETPGVEPVRASDIVRSQEGLAPDEIRVPRRRGHLVTREAAGYLETRDDIIRAKETLDLYNSAHEWGHALQKKTVGLDWMPENVDVRNELLKLGEPQWKAQKLRDFDRRIAEGWAEFWSRYQLADPNLATQYPKAHDFMMKFLTDRPGPMRQAMRTRELFNRWNLQGAVQRKRMQLRLAGDKPGTIERMAREAKQGKLHKRLFDRIITDTFVDETAKYIRSEEYWKAGLPEGQRELPISASPIRVRNALLYASEGVVETFLKRGTMGFMKKDYTGAPLKESLKNISIDEHRAFMTYYSAKRDLELLDMGMTTMQPKAELLYVVEQLENPRFLAAQEGIRSYLRRVLDYVVEAGGFSEAEAEAIHATHQFYLPYDRVMYNRPVGRPGARDPLAQGPGVKRLRGGAMEEISDPMVALMNMTRSLINKAHQGAVQKAGFRMWMETKGETAGLVTLVKPDVKPHTYDIKTILNALGKAEGTSDLVKAIKAGDLDGVITLFHQEFKPKPGEPITVYTPKFTEAEIKAELDPHVRSLMEQYNGKTVRMEWDPDAYDAMLTMNEPKALKGLWKILSYPAGSVMYGATRTSVDFFIRNAFMRDPMMWQAFTAHAKGIEKIPVVGGLFAWFEGMVKQYKGSEYARAFRDFGGTGAGFYRRTRPAATTRLEEIYAKSNVQTMGPAQLLRTIGRGLRRYEEALGAGESALRIVEFERAHKAALAEGKNDLEAMLEALEAGREITINFARGTEISKKVSMALPYFNANVQAQRKFWRGITGKDGKRVQRQMTWNGLTSMTALSALQYLLAGDEDWYKDLPEWAKFNYWHFKLPGTEKLIRLPKNYEYGKLFSNPFEYLIDTIGEKNPVEAKSIVWDFLSGMFMNGAFVPVVIGPSVESWANKSLYTGRELVPWWMEKTRLPEDQYTAYTTWMAKTIAKGLGGVGLQLSPAKMEQFISSSTGGLGLRLMQSVDMIRRATGMEEKPFLGGEVRLEDIPGLSTLFRMRPHKMGRAEQELRELATELGQKAGSQKLEPFEVRARPMVNRALERISELNKAVHVGRMTLEESDRRSYEVARRALDTYERMMR